jgi:hypothetical protein
MADFNSSDMEFEPPPQNPFHQAGQASILKLIDHAFEDRVASKRAVKQLTNVKGSPKTQYMRALWWNRFNTFRQHTLNKGYPISLQRVTRSSLTAAEGQTYRHHLRTSKGSSLLLSAMLRLAGTRSRHIPGSRLPLPSRSIFHYKTFTLSPHERSRIVTLLHSLFQEGKVTKDPGWVRNWAGVVVVRKLASSLFNQAFREGTMTWDIPIAKCLSIVLVAALGVRTGDVTVAPHDEHTLPFLAYEDIVIRLKDGDTIDDLEAVVTIRNEKGSKYVFEGLDAMCELICHRLDPKKKRIVVLKALQSSSDSLMCPIKLFLTLALRLGNVAETSIEDLLMHTAQRNNRTVLWRFPKRPVLCALSSVGGSILVDKPAGNHQLSSIMSQATLAAGLLGQFRAHDLRRGAARDTANLSGKLKGSADKMTAAVLGHNESAANRSLTAHYVGGVVHDTWTKRVDENFNDPVYDIPNADSPYQRKFQAFTADEITEACLSKGLRTVAQKDRKRGAQLLEKRRQAEWADQENRKRQMLNEGYRSASTSRTAGLPTRPDESEDITTSETNASGDFPLDPQLAQYSQALCNVMSGADDGVAEPEIEGLIYDSAQGLGSPIQGPEWGDTLGFVRLFSTINITCNQGLQQSGPSKKNIAQKEKILSVLQGNSRDDVTSFIYACKNHVHGCTYTHGYRVEISAHELTCPVTSQSAFEDLAKKEAAKTFACTEQGCSKMFDTVGKRNRHVKDLHGWPKPCPKGCKIDALPTRHAMVKHMESHSKFSPSKCLVPGCTSKTVFQRAQVYRYHIKMVHKMTGKAVDPYMPYPKKAKFTPTKCKVEGCISQATFTLPISTRRTCATVTKWMTTRLSFTLQLQAARLGCENTLLDRGARMLSWRLEQG